MKMSAFLAFFVCSAVYCQSFPQPLTHVDSCSRFSKSVVRIDTADGRGTGFIVSPDGYIVTAAHVVIERNTGQFYRAIDVTLPNSWTELATPVLDITEAAIHDFALLKINKTDLPFLELGDEEGIEIGSDMTIIGFPFSALDEKEQQINVKFCLASTVAATTSFGIGKSQVNVIYFQGVSVKGISGSPIISHKTGQVIGVVNTKLSGIGPSLDSIRKNIRSVGEVFQATGANGNGYGLGGSILPVIDLLDNQLANGLGSGTGAADAAYALKKAKREYERQHPTTK